MKKGGRVYRKVEETKTLKTRKGKPKKRGAKNGEALRQGKLLKKEGLKKG